MQANERIRRLPMATWLMVSVNDGNSCIALCDHRVDERHSHGASADDEVVGLNCGCQVASSLLACTSVRQIAHALRMNANRQRRVTPHHVRINPLGFANYLDVVEAPEDFFPDDLELQLGEPHSIL